MSVHVTVYTSEPVLGTVTAFTPSSPAATRPGAAPPPVSVTRMQAVKSADGAGVKVTSKPTDVLSVPVSANTS